MNTSQKKSFKVFVKTKNGKLKKKYIIANTKFDNFWYDMFYY